MVKYKKMHASAEWERICVYKKAVTLKDVAESSGYSLRTVKKVLSSNEPVKPATRETVLRVAREMGYRKNRIASVLANHKVYKIAIVITAIFSRRQRKVFVNATGICRI